MKTEFVWVFTGPKRSFPGGVFNAVELAEEWIKKHGLTGVLTKYPLDIGAFDWAIENSLYTKRSPEREGPDFIGSFSSASFEHFHYEDGIRA